MAAPLDHTPLRRPPIRQSTMVRSDVEHTFTVELTFSALGPSLTRVAVEHRGWEALSEAQLREDCAEPGDYAAGAFATGWARILAALAAAVPGGPA